MLELVAVLLSRQVLQKMTSHKLLSDRRSALWEKRRTFIFVLLPESYEACRQSSNPDFAQHARNYRIVNAAMGEEILVFRSDNCVTDNPRDVLILCEPPVLSCQFHERLAVGIVNGADRRKLKAGEWFNVRQGGSIKIDVMDSNCN